VVIPHNKKLKTNSQVLRTSMTDAEIRIWSHIRLKQVKGLQFYRQKPIGKYIVDFYCPKIKLVIEIDCGQHYKDALIHRDQIRDEFMKKLGIMVLRYTNTDVIDNIDGVIENLLFEIERTFTNLP